MGINTKKYACAALFAALFAILLAGCEPNATKPVVITPRLGISSDINPLSVTGFTPTATSDPNGVYSLITDLTSLKFSQDYAENGTPAININRPVYKKENADDDTAWYLWVSFDLNRYVLSRREINDGWYFEATPPASRNPKDVRQWRRATVSAKDIASDPNLSTNEPNATTGVMITSLSIALKNGSSASVFTGDRIELEPTIMPSNATDTSLEWKSSNTAVATVDANGVVTATGGGTVDITATSMDGSSITSNAIPIMVTVPVIIRGQPTIAYDPNTKKLSFSVTFSETVTLDSSRGTPNYKFTVTKSANITPLTKTAAYVRGSGVANTLVFEYTKELGTFGTVSYAENPINLNGGSLTGTSVPRVSLAGITPNTAAATIAPEEISAVGIADRNIIPDSALRASSEWDANTSAAKGRLNGPDGWAPREIGNSFWEVNLGKERDIVRIATQGLGNNNDDQKQWIANYIITYFDNNKGAWRSYENGRPLNGNRDKNSIVTNNLTPFRTQYVRISPRQYYIYPRGRFELYEAK